MPPPSKAYLIESALYGDPPSPPGAMIPDPSGVEPPADEPRAPDTPTNYIPGLYTLGSTYNVLNGRYADSRSTVQQIIDWSKSMILHQHLLQYTANRLYR